MFSKRISASPDRAVQPPKASEAIRSPSYVDRSIHDRSRVPTGLDLFCACDRLVARIRLSDSIDAAYVSFRESGREFVLKRTVILARKTVEMRGTSS